jgi:hypothetical protein
MPEDVLAYLSWLAQEDIGRARVESEGEAELPSLLPMLMTGGMGMDADTSESNPVPQHTQQFNYWNQKLVALLRHHSTLQDLGYFWTKFHAPGSPHVPESCSLLHSLYQQHVQLQADAVKEIAAGMATKDISRVTKQMEATKRAQDLLRRSDEQFGFICAKYNVQQWYHIKVTPGETPLPATLPR